jgi:hypothetical protein
MAPKGGRGKAKGEKKKKDEKGNYFYLINSIVNNFAFYFAIL